jgi:hypothetical protein
MSGNATNKAAQLDHRVPLARAEVQRVGSEWLETSTKAEALDGRMHIATDPAMVPDTIERMRTVDEPPLPPRPQPAPVPTEGELRGRLAERLAEQREAEQAMVTAVAAADRARDLLSERQRALASFTGLDERIAQFTIDRLRESGQATVPDEYRAQITARDAAFTDLQAAEQAHVVLSAELDAARQRVEQRRQLATAAALTVLNTEAARVLARHKAATLAAEAAYVELCEFDRFTSGTRGHPMPIGVGALLRSPPLDLRSWVASPKLDTARWRGALARLLADPLAAIEPEPASPPELENVQ